ncbi:hypothetical protein [Mesorhizobium sp.]|uniref:hypothetical protein n=1 Tax=Mesorhizobium sp. TaxID=1871066 RepID=UPI00257CE6AE|nr:hypothetical protein [Mesorhizobium sp.]
MPVSAAAVIDAAVAAHMGESTAARSTNRERINEKSCRTARAVKTAFQNVNVERRCVSLKFRSFERNDGVVHLRAVAPKNRDGRVRGVNREVILALTPLHNELLGSQHDLRRARDDLQRRSRFRNACQDKLAAFERGALRIEDGQDGIGPVGVAAPMVFSNGTCGFLVVSWATAPVVARAKLPAKAIVPLMRLMFIELSSPLSFTENPDARTRRL